MSTISVTATLLLTKPNVLMKAKSLARPFEVDFAVGVERGGNHGSDQVAILGHGIAGDRINNFLGIRPRDAAILQRIVVIADALQIGFHEAPADLGTLGHELSAVADHRRLLVRIETTHGRKPNGETLLCHDRNERLRGDTGVEAAVAEGGDLLVDAEKCPLAIAPPKAAASESLVEDGLLPDACGHWDCEFQALEVGEALELAALDEGAAHDDGLEAEVWRIARFVGNELDGNLSFVCVVVPRRHRAGADVEFTGSERGDHARSRGEG